ncbi:MAG: hypothetical protein U0229_24290 [Anaeromyxobacter sp.]
MPRPGEQTFHAPMPTRWTVLMRTFLPWQAWRFAWINLKMIRMITIGHHGEAPTYQWRTIDPGKDAPQRGA